MKFVCVKFLVLYTVLNLYNVDARRIKGMPQRQLNSQSTSNGGKGGKGGTYRSTYIASDNEGKLNTSGKGGGESGGGKGGKGSTTTASLGKGKGGEGLSTNTNSISAAFSTEGPILSPTKEPTSSPTLSPTKALTKAPTAANVSNDYGNLIGRKLLRERKNDDKISSSNKQN